MAINSNPRHKARHKLFAATTGGGKTTAIHQDRDLQKAQRVVIYDPYNAYRKLGRKRVTQTHSIKAFAIALAQAMQKNKPFVLALSGVYGVKELDVFAKILWAVADGNKQLHVVVEELIGSVSSPNQLPKAVAELWNGGRQFGLVMYALFQRPQEVPKTVVRQSQFKWVGKQDSKADCRYWSAEIDVPVEALSQLNDLEFYLKASGQNPNFGKLRAPA
ncbi:hypothetical protein [Enterovibrio coralii]|uniref:Uncharacterized protein n=1 Tax=Enterovibrio coralii TaxID=294935 RepID=A0A135I720_9GAMM|nr:hypothetical protein [Enterovibrio coralii]KXF81207.1 hypothetical protein ATN88_00085 [Enterovibrio coralii]